jgi:hypothetical protein
MSHDLAEMNIGSFIPNYIPFEVDPDHSKMTHFLSSLDFPKLYRKQSGFLDSPRTLEELRSALTSMKRGKSPGLGFPPELFLEIWY